MERSIKFYSEILGYQTVVYDSTEDFADWHGVDGGFGRYRRVLLRHPEKRKGPFSPLLGDTEIELVQSLDRAPRKVFENRFWGDLGYIHLCFDITGMAEMKKACEAKGYPFTVDSSGSFDMGEAAGYCLHRRPGRHTHRIRGNPQSAVLSKKLAGTWICANAKTRRSPLALDVKMMGMGRVRD